MAERDFTYYGSDWDEVREEIIEDYGSECLLCLSSENLHVHHITPLKEFDNPDLANNPENLVPLCSRCHGRVEHIQNPHTRRTVDHFMEELKAEGLPDLRRVVEEITYHDLKTNNLDTCPSESCFYAVKQTDWTCPSCGTPLSRDLSTSIRTGVWVCRACGFNEVGEQPEPPFPHIHNCPANGDNLEFVSDASEIHPYKCSKCGEKSFLAPMESFNSHGCSAPGGHHGWRLVEKEEAKPGGRMGLLWKNDGITIMCDSDDCEKVLEDGYGSVSEAREAAKDMGWWVTGSDHPDSTDLCPDHNPQN